MLHPSAPDYDPGRYDINGKRLTDRLEADTDWMSTEEAAAMLATTASGLGSLYREVQGVDTALPRISRSLSGKSARAVGYLYRRKAVEKLAAIRKGARVSLLQAVRVLVWLHKGTI